VLTGKTCLVTGAAQGIGRASAVEMARQGAVAVALADLDVEGAEGTAQLVRAQGASALVVRTDAREASSLRDLLDAVDRELGALDVLHNNVGITEAQLTDQLAVDVLPVEVWDLVMQVNLRSCFLTTQYAVPLLRRSRLGPSIVNTASTSGKVAAPRGPAYAASKGGVVMLTKATAVDLSPDIRCNCVCPGTIETPMAQQYIARAEDPAAQLSAMTGAQLVPRLGLVEEVAALVCFLASDAAGFTTGAAYDVDGGKLAWRGARA
jgi:NAD(P)-dependent dehydrogenase (short-subunit alcohol dehydrogenase family)